MRTRARKSLLKVAQKFIKPHKSEPIEDKNLVMEEARVRLHLPGLGADVHVLPSVRGRAGERISTSADKEKIGHENGQTNKYNMKSGSALSFE